MADIQTQPQPPADRPGATTAISEATVQLVEQKLLNESLESAFSELQEKRTSIKQHLPQSFQTFDQEVAQGLEKAGLLPQLALQWAKEEFPTLAGDDQILQSEELHSKPDDDAVVQAFKGNLLDKNITSSTGITIDQLTERIASTESPKATQPGIPGPPGSTETQEPAPPASPEAPQPGTPSAPGSAENQEPAPPASPEAPQTGTPSAPGSAETQEPAPPDSPEAPQPGTPSAPGSAETQEPAPPVSPDSPAESKPAPSETLDIHPLDTEAPRQFELSPDGSAKYVVKSGDTVWSIAKDYLMSSGMLKQDPSAQEIKAMTDKIAEASGLNKAGRTPDLIYPGETISIPPQMETAPEASPSPPPSHAPTPTPTPEVRR